MKNDSTDYVIRVLNSVGQIDSAQWDSMLARQDAPTPFMRHAYLLAMEQSASATPATGWTPRFVSVWQGKHLAGACALYLKDHSYGEYVFDWAWANAYEQHGLAYYPKAVIATPFTPVPGSRLLAQDDAARKALVDAVIAWCRQQKLSSVHLLFASEQDMRACQAAGLMLRHTVQFHWSNQGWAGFDDFLASLSQEKRKKIRQERRKVAQAGVSWRWARGAQIGPANWDLFYRCYERTYLEHGNSPYLTREFFEMTAMHMPDSWLMFIAEREGRAIACSLIALGEQGQEKVAYGRYWGALERVDCLHFEACYYQPLQWCIDHGWHRFEGGAQGEHKMARALMPVKTSSAHWLAQPAFADAVERFLAREGQGIAGYMEQLENRSPFRQGAR